MLGYELIVISLVVGVFLASMPYIFKKLKLLLGRIKTQRVRHDWL